MSPAEHSSRSTRVVCVHLKDAAEALTVVLDGVVDVRTCLCLTRVNTNVGKLTNIRVSHDLECKSGEWLLNVCMTDSLAPLGVYAINLMDIQRAWKEVDNCVQKLLNTLFL